MYSLRPLRSTLAIAALATLAGVAPAQSRKITDRRIVTYTGRDINMWGSTNQARGYLSPILIGPKIDTGDTTIGAIGEIVTPEVDALPLFYIPSYRLGKTGAKLTFGGGVEMGLRVYPWLDRGTLSYKYVAGVDLTYDSLPFPNEQTTVSARFVGCAGSTYSTTNPSIGMKMGAVAKVYGHADVDAWFLGGNLYTGSAFNFNEGGETIFKPVTPIPGEDPDLLVKFDGNDVTTRLNDFLRILNPTPIGAELAVPNLETRSTPISGDGTLEAKTFSKFLSVQTDLASWTIGLIPGPLGKALKAAISGNYPVPATDYRVTWDFAKTYASLDVGLIAASSLRPSTQKPPNIRIVVYDIATNKVITPTQTVVNGVTQATFTMPKGGVRIEPELDLTLEFRSRVAMGVGGEVGTEPVRVTAKGTLGYGTRIAPVDFDFSVGKYVWKPAPSEGATFGSENKFDLDAPEGGRVRNMGAFSFHAFDKGNLPNEVYGRSGAPDPYPLLIPAYDSDNSGSDNFNNEVKTVPIVAQQGFSFFPADANVVATLRPLGGGEAFTLARPTVQSDTMQVALPTPRLKPGKYTLEIGITTKNGFGQPVSATYQVPTTAYNPRVTVSPQVFTSSGLESGSLTNRVEIDGRDSVLYLGGARGILNSTQVVLDDTYVLPNDFATLDETALANQSQGRRVGFTIPGILKAQLAGGRHTIKLRAPSLIRGGNGELLTPFESEAIPLYIVSGVPQIDNIAYNNVLGAKPPVRKGGYVIEVKGANFSNTTVVTADGYAKPLLTEYSTPSSLRVTITDEVLAFMRASSRAGLVLKASTPVVDVEAGGNNEKATTIGGVSTPKAFTFTYDRPALNRIANPTSESEGKITLLGQETTVRVYGDNLYVPSTSGEPTTNFTFDGASIATSRVTYPAYDASTLTVPYVDILLPASGTAKARTLTAYNPISTDNASTISISNEYAVPVLNTINGNNRIKILTSGPQSVSAVGGAVSSATRLVLGESNFGGGSLGDGRTLGVTISSSTLNGVGGKTVQASFRNPAPGGGDSAPITVTLDEGNPNTLTLTKGLLTYDRASNAWKQEITVKYGGTHTLDTARILFQGLPVGIQLVNSNGTFNGLPFANVPMKGGSTAKFVALFRVPAGTAVSYTAAPAIP